MEKPSLFELKKKLITEDDFSSMWEFFLDHFGEDDDVQETVLGRMQGYILQANFIESLLSEKDVRPAVPCLFNWIAGVGIFLGFEYLIWRYRDLQALAVVAALVSAIVLAMWFAGAVFQRYFDPVPVGVLAILYFRGFKYLARLIRRVA